MEQDLVRMVAGLNPQMFQDIQHLWKLTLFCKKRTPFYIIPRHFFLIGTEFYIKFFALMIAIHQNTFFNRPPPQKKKENVAMIFPAAFYVLTFFIISATPSWAIVLPLDQQ